MRALLTGGRGMLASSIAAAWRRIRPGDELLVVGRGEIDLRDVTATRALMASVGPDLVIHTAAFVGGIADKTARPLPYLLENLQIDASVLRAAVDTGVGSYLYTASAAAYPADAPSPITEDSLFAGRLEPANEGYGLAKLTGLTAVRYAAQQSGGAYRSILPSNLYGPGDTFDPQRAHLIASTIRKTHEARESASAQVDVWGDGSARREFTYAPDLAAWLAASVDDIATWPDVMNIGAGEDHSVRDFYELAGEVVGFDGELAFDPTKPSGVARRLIDSSRARRHGWIPRTGMREGMTACYEAFLERTTNGERR